MSPRREIERSPIPWILAILALLASVRCRTLRQETARCEAKRIATDDITKRCCPLVGDPHPLVVTQASSAEWTQACDGLHTARRQAREAIQASASVLDASPSAPDLKKRLRSAWKALSNAYKRIVKSCQ